MTVRKNNPSDTRDMKVGQRQEHDVPASGKLDRSQFQDEFTTVDSPRWEEKAKTLSAFEEMVEVMVAEDSHPNAEQIVHLSVNGRNQFLFRGKPTWIKRKFLHVLAAARPESLSTPEYTDANGNRATKIIKTPGLKYPFQVLTDMNPDGRRLLESALSGQ